MSATAVMARRRTRCPTTTRCPRVTGIPGQYAVYHTHRRSRLASGASGRTAWCSGARSLPEGLYSSPPGSSSPGPVAGVEDSKLAKDLLEQAMGGHGVPDVAHADRGTSGTPKPVAQLLADLGRTRSHSRPHVSSDNPYSRRVQDPHGHAGVPGQLRRAAPCPIVRRRVLRLLQPFRGCSNHEHLEVFRLLVEDEALLALCCEVASSALNRPLVHRFRWGVVHPARSGVQP